MDEFKRKYLKRILLSIILVGIVMNLNPRFSETSAGPAGTILRPNDLLRHTYEFYVDGVLDPEKTQVLTNGEILRNPGEAKSISNKKFEGWFKEGESEEMRFGTSGTPVTVTSNETIRIYGKYTDVVYVTFVNDAANQTNDKVIRVKTLTPGETTDGDRIPVVVYQTGKAFKHWSTQRGGGPFDFSNPINENTVLYSVLSNQWRVSFDSDGGVCIPPQYIESGKTATKPEPPTRVGYTFKEWHDEIGNVYNFNTPITGDKKLKAIWEPNRFTQYKVVYLQEKKEGDNTVDNYSVYEVETRSGPTDADATFDYKNYTGFTLDIEKTNAAKTTISPEGDTIRKVYYKRNRYIFRFMSRNSWSPSVYYNAGYVKYGQNTKIAWDKMRQNAPAYASYTWYLTPTGNVSYSIYPDMPNKALDVYGRKDGNYNYAIMFKERIGGVNTNNAIRDEFAFMGSQGLSLTIEDYISVPGFTVHSRPNDGSERSVYNYNLGRYEWNLYYTRNNYNLTFHTNDGTEGITYSGIPYQASIADKKPPEYIEGETIKVIDGLEHTFRGWYEDVSTAGEPYSLEGKTMPHENLILYAGWEPSRHKVDIHKVIDPDGEHEFTPEIDHMQPITSVIQEVDLSKIKPDGASDDNFLGWYWFQRDNIFVPFNFNTPIFQNVELFPVWGGIEYKLQYDLNGGTPKDSLKDSSAYLPYTHAILKDPIEGGIKPPSEELIFLGWQGKNDAFYHANSLLYMDQETIKLEAEWGPKRESADVTYNPNGGNGEVKKLDMSNNATHVVQDDAFTDSDMYTREGYRFAGWNTKEDGTGQAFQKGEEIVIQNVNTNILYAQWESDAKVNVAVIKKWVVNDEENDKYDYTLQLKADGQPYGEPVTVPKSEAGHTWTDLPKEKKTGPEFQEIVYTVEELNIPDGYRENISDPIISSDGNTITYEITNFQRTFLPGTGGHGFGIFNLISGILGMAGLFIGFKKLDIISKLQNTIK